MSDSRTAEVMHDLRAAQALLQRALTLLEARPAPQPDGPERPKAKPVRYLGDTDPSGGDAA